MRKYLKRLILFTMVLSLLIQTTQIPAMDSTVGDSQNHSLESETTNYEMVATNLFRASEFRISHNWRLMGRCRTCWIQFVEIR